jgi:hypothetical protein
MGALEDARIAIHELDRNPLVGGALVTSGERFRHGRDATSFDEQEIAHPGHRQRYDLVFVFKDKAKAPTFVEAAQFFYEHFERPMRPNIEYVIRHVLIIPALRAFGKTSAATLRV